MKHSKHSTWKAFTPTQLAAITELAQAGFSTYKIAEVVHHSHQAVSQRLRRLREDGTVRQV
jgi:DNA-binding Lrp family transcriptional regulator